MATTKTLLTYPNQLPATYENSSLMSPDRRVLYLSHKTGVRTVHPIKAADIPNITTDARMPIDLCCVHRDNGIENTYVFYSSKMITVAKQQEEREDLGKLGTMAVQAIAAKPIKLDLKTLKNLPRKKETRHQNGYNKIPVNEAGEVMLNGEHYPILPESKRTTYTLDTATWYVWLAILMEYGDNFTTVFEHNGHNYFAIQNPYNMVVQML